MIGALVYNPHPQPPPPEWSLEDFLKHQPTKFDGKISPNQVDQWMKDMECIFDSKRCLDESKLAFHCLHSQGRLSIVGQHEVGHGRET